MTRRLTEAQYQDKANAYAAATERGWLKVVEEFDNFAPAELPQMPDTFEDASWHNDSCPSMTSEKLRLHVFCDAEDLDDREVPTMPRYTVDRLDAEGCLTEGPSLLDTEEWSEVLALIEKERSR